MNKVTAAEAKEIAEQIVGFELRGEYVHPGDKQGVRFEVEDTIHPSPPSMEIYFEKDGELAERKVVMVAEGMVDGMKRDGIYENYT